MKFWDKLLKKPKILAICVLLFWSLLVSININKILNVSDYVEDEGSNLTTSRPSESSVGTDILASFSEVNSSFQILIYNPDGSILTDEIHSFISSLIYNISHNPNIGPFLSPSQPYSSLFDDADNLLRSILNLQWFATQMSFSSIHFVWGGLEYFSNIWSIQYNATSDIEFATGVAKTLTKNYVETVLSTYNESRYLDSAFDFYNHFSSIFELAANSSTPNNLEEVILLSKSIISNNVSFFEEITSDYRQQQLLLSISDNFNMSMWQNPAYGYQKISEFLFDSNETSCVDFVQEVYADGDIEGFIDAKNKYLLPILRLEQTIPPITNDIIETFLKQYTNYNSSIGKTDATIVKFNVALNHLNEKGKGVYLELLEILPQIKEDSIPLEIHATGIDFFIIEISLDYEQQLSKTDLIVIISIVVILLLVYRSPILPLIQIFVLAIAFGVSRLIFIGIGTSIGGLGSTSLMILSVSLLGATTDYCVFLMGDYLQNLQNTKTKMDALKVTLKRTSKSIVISSISLTVGFGALILSRFATATGLGIGGSIGFLTSMVVSLTLIPALLILIKADILTKWRINFKLFKKRKFSIMKYVKKSVQNPKKILVIALVISIIGTVIFFVVPTDYAQISTAPPTYYSRQGLDAINEHMGVDQISQVIILFKTTDVDPFLLENQSLNIDSINHVLAIVEEVSKEADLNIISGLSHPLGTPYHESMENSSLFLIEEIQILMKNFILADSTYGIVVCGSQYVEGDEKLDIQIEAVRDTIQSQLAERDISSWNTYVTGFAPVLYDSKMGISLDFNLIFVFASLAIVSLLLLFLRDFLMSIRVLVTIMMSLGISLGIFSIIALLFLGGQIYWIVPLMLYAVLTALGLDFDVLFLGIFDNIYQKKQNSGEAIIESVRQTMNNISVAGLIMAVTYLSLVFTSSIHMQQLGLGLGIGILVDVFVSRLFIVPPAIVVSFREEKKKKKAAEKKVIKDEK
ncbi:MAG: MMPL family transporter [Candidatus Heimdallarchaeota archaeon]|nr:MMPL family transporter [Candidatus Heimdallarchaeota archaeon]